MKNVVSAAIVTVATMLAACSPAPAASHEETGTAVQAVDAYAVPGPYYNSAGVVGPQSNPFTFDMSQTTATPDHYQQYAVTTNASGQLVYGQFISPVNHKGVITGYNWVQCGIGAGC